MPNEQQPTLHITVFLREKAAEARSGGKSAYADALHNVMGLVPETATMRKREASQALYAIFQMTSVEYDSAEWWMAIAQAAVLLNSISVAAHF